MTGGKEFESILASGIRIPRGVPRSVLFRNTPLLAAGYLISPDDNGKTFDLPGCGTEFRRRGRPSTSLPDAIMFAGKSRTRDTAECRGGSRKESKNHAPGSLYEPPAVVNWRQEDPFGARRRRTRRVRNEPTEFFQGGICFHGSRDCPPGACPPFPVTPGLVFRCGVSIP